MHKKLLKMVADPPDDGGMTAHELALAANISLASMQTRLKNFNARGLLVVGGKMAKDSQGRRVRVPVYRLKEGK